ncbi:MAG: methyltransferase domain-containing protein [Lachnospiraceae bacterium]|nr:methyltransferase domain-containing protein [Lachnospiraceae bacterium]
MKKYVLFGAGVYAQKAIELLGKENIEIILDNDSLKWGNCISDILICNPKVMVDSLKNGQVIISVSQKYQQQIIDQLGQLGIQNIKTIQEVQTDITKRRLENRLDYIGIYNKAVMWIQNNTLDGQAIICNTDKRKGYPEVTGYYIPTLLRWGYRDLAVSYAKWLCSIQKEDGSWYDTDDRNPYIFDTAQILKGLVAVREIYPQADQYLLRGCDWMLRNMQEDGRLVTPSMEAWGNGKACSELIHTYCLSPLVQVADALQKPEYKDAAYKILNYYKNNHYDEIMNFDLLSHFYAYVMEALLDMGERDMALEAMEKVARVQKESGAVPAYRDVDWVCSTGLFQLALVWFRLGNVKRGNRAFTYACKLQNESGGWYGSYLSEQNPYEDNDYFPSSEISWAVKYFLDALYYKNIVEFDLYADSFLNKIAKDDGRYQIVRNTILAERIKKKQALRVLDVGCGKGRYLKNLTENEPENIYYAVDLSEKVMEYITADRVVKKQGTLTKIDYPDGYFDVVYTCEALEHAIDIANAVKEMARITKDGGKIVIIDKNRAELGRMEIGEWEVWFDAEALKGMMSEYCSDVHMIDEIDYEQRKEDKLFLAWIGTVVKEK